MHFYKIWRQVDPAKLELIPRFSKDGIFPDDSLDIVRKVVEVSLEKVRTAQINPRDVFTNEFVKERR